MAADLHCNRRRLRQQEHEKEEAVKFVFAMPGFSDQKYRRCLDAVGADRLLMSYYYLLEAAPGQLRIYVEQGHAAECAWRAKCNSSS